MRADEAGLTGPCLIAPCPPRAQARRDGTRSYFFIGIDAFCETVARAFGPSSQL